MKKVGIITVHAAHNYGSCLQAYALQRKIAEMGYDCEIINLRLPIQKEIYQVFTKRKNVKYILKNVYTLFFICKDRKEKHDKFEKFITQEMRLSREINSFEQFEKIVNEYDCVITGSDQIWSKGIEEFTDAYLLPNVKGVKISYAVSCGEEISENFTDEEIDFIKNIDYISVRDSGTARFVKEKTGRDSELVLDPTMFFDKEYYSGMCGEERLIKEKYIYLYTLGNSEELLNVTKALSKKTGLPVYISNVSGTHYMFGLKKALASGPKEFLNHIKFAEYVVTSSFHGTVFSILFEKQFWVFKAQKDERKRELLAQVGLSDRSIEIKDCETKFEQIISKERYSNAKENIFSGKEKSVRFLTEALA